MIPVSKPNSAFVRLRAGIISSEKAIRKCLSAIFRILSTVTKRRKYVLFNFKMLYSINEFNLS
jgi:hypothetical protein